MQIPEIHAHHGAVDVHGLDPIVDADGLHVFRDEPSFAVALDDAGLAGVGGADGQELRMPDASPPSAMEVGAVVGGGSCPR